jgi:hypothetical protein
MAKTSYAYPALFVLVAAYFVFEFVSSGRLPNVLFLIVAGMVLFYFWDRDIKRKKTLDESTEKQDEEKK